MDKVLSANEFINSKLNPNRSGRTDVIEIDYASELVIEFAKLHVQKALQQGHNNNFHGISYEDYIKAYPLENIK